MFPLRIILCFGLSEKSSIFIAGIFVLKGICNLLFEYGLLTNQQVKDLNSVALEKIMALKNIENIIAEECEKHSQ